MYYDSEVDFGYTCHYQKRKIKKTKRSVIVGNYSKCILTKIPIIPRYKRNYHRRMNVKEPMKWETLRLLSGPNQHTEVTRKDLILSNSALL